MNQGYHRLAHVFPLAGNLDFLGLNGDHLDLEDGLVFDSEILLYSVKECRQCFFNNCERTISISVSESRLCTLGTLHFAG